MDAGLHPPRPRIPNPNHSNPSPASSSPSSAPSTQQPPPLLQSHFSRDPFRPPSQHEKRDAPMPSLPLWQSSAHPQSSSYQPHDQRDSVQLAPPHPPSPYSRPPAYGPEQSHSRRGSLVNDLQTNGHDSVGGQPSVNGRHMLPPAAISPTRRTHFQPPSSYPSRDQAPPIPTSSSPSSTPAPRSTNMSISSVLDTDTSPRPRPPTWSPLSSRNGQYAPHNPAISPTPPHAPHNGDERRPNGNSPQYGPVYNPRPQPTPAHNGSFGSPDRQRNGIESILHHPPQAGYTTSAAPASQPSVADGRIEDHRDPPRAMLDRLPNSYGHALSTSYDGRPASDEHRFDSAADAAHRDRAESGAMQRYGPPLPPAAPAGAPEPPRLDSRFAPGHWHANDSTELRDEDRPIMSREGPLLPEDITYGPHLPAWYAHGRGATGTPLDHPAASSPFSTNGRRGPVLDSQLRRSLEESQMAHRSVLNASQEAQRRVERGSPLPQAVQGASSQPVGLRRDPNIKTEFTRVFSGLGSGVGSTPVPMPPNGSPTPVRRFDGADDEADDFGPRSSAKRNKRPYDFDGRPDSDGEASKRRAAHHHHHHQANRPHHHHLKADESLPAALLSRRASGTPLGLAKDGLPNGSLGHPHHHHALHHHHTTPRALSNPAPIVPIRRPVVTIKTQPLLQSVAHLPRRHLGSQVYAPTVAMPSSRSTPLFTKFPYASKPNPLPDFTGKENCTFTVRIPRFYLSDHAREHAYHQRQVWGTDVYTDDSDPLAAAIHSGWIRGSWPADVDQAMLELDGPLDDAAKNKPDAATAPDAAPAAALLTSPPAAGPVNPPPGRDAHVTLLVLPALDKYTASTWHGIRSRSWGANHDGLSFKVHRVEWVDEGAVSRAAPCRRKAARDARLAARLKEQARCHAAPAVVPRKSASASGNKATAIPV